MAKRYRDTVSLQYCAHLQTLLSEGDHLGLLTALPKTPERLAQLLDTAYARGFEDAQYYSLPEVVARQIDGLRRAFEWNPLHRRQAPLQEQRLRKLERLALYLDKLQKGELTVDEAIQAEKLAQKLEAAA